MGPLEGEKQGVLGEARRKVPETICPQEGKEQDQNTLRGTGLRAERKVSQQLPAACLRSLGHWPPLHPMALADVGLGQASVTDLRPLGAWHCAGRGHQGVTPSTKTLSGS